MIHPLNPNENPSLTPTPNPHPHKKTDEKTAIARSYLEPQARSDAGVPPGSVSVTDDALGLLIDSYCREAGVRNLKKHLEKLYRKAALKLVQVSNRGRVGLVGAAGAGGGCWGQGSGVSKALVIDYVSSDLWHQQKPKTIPQTPTPHHPPPSQGGARRTDESSAASTSSSTGDAPAATAAAADSSSGSDDESSSASTTTSTTTTTTTTSSSEAPSSGDAPASSSAAPEQPPAAGGSSASGGGSSGVEYTGEPVVINGDGLQEYVGLPPFAQDRFYDTTPQGVVMGLAWTAMGGATLYVEAAKVSQVGLGWVGLGFMFVEGLVEGLSAFGQVLLGLGGGGWGETVFDRVSRWVACDCRAALGRGQL